MIIARATPPGRGAIAILRIDGRGTGELLRRIFRPLGSRRPESVPRRMIRGHVIDPRHPERIIDDALAVFFAARNSYTGNDLAEIHCHGGPAVIRGILAAATAAGPHSARAARPGEFTERAFLNGKLDLARAEAVADLIGAETEAAARSARAQLAGGLSGRVSDLRAGLIDLAAEIEARIDFPDEDLGEADAERMNAAFDRLADELARLLATRRRGRLLRDGVRVALVGPPNVGKSSLLNALARSERAIVTPHPGTTRDTIECRIDLEGIPVTLIDTAGIRETAEPVELAGIERSRRVALDADWLIEVRDASAQVPFDAGRPPHLVALNKCDLVAATEPGGVIEEARAIRTSARTGEGLAQLESALHEIISGQDEGGESGAGDGIAVSERHGALLESAASALRSARAQRDAGGGGELVMIDLRDALGALDELLGLAPGEAILDRVFEKFCMGK